MAPTWSLFGAGAAANGALVVVAGPPSGLSGLSGPAPPAPLSRSAFSAAALSATASAALFAAMASAALFVARRRPPSRFLKVAQAISLRLQPLLLDFPVLDLLPPPIHEPLALETTVEERALADVSFHCRDAIGLARDRLGGERRRKAC